MEVLEGAYIEAENAKKHRITPQHISVAVNQDAELKELLKDVVFPQGGVVPYIHSELLQKNTKRSTSSEY